MPRTIDFDGVRVEWVQFRPDRSAAPAIPPRLEMEAFGYLLNDQGTELPVKFEGWERVKPSTRAAIETALVQLAFELAADELTLADGDGLVIEPGKIRPAEGDERPVWVKR